MRRVIQWRKELEWGLKVNAELTEAIGCRREGIKTNDRSGRLKIGELRVPGICDKWCMPRKRTRKGGTHGLCGVPFAKRGFCNSSKLPRSCQQRTEAPKSCCLPLIPIRWNSIGRRYWHTETGRNSKGGPQGPCKLFVKREFISLWRRAIARNVTILYHKFGSLPTF